MKAKEAEQMALFVDSNDITDLWQSLEREDVGYIRPRKNQQLNLRIDRHLMAALRKAAAAKGTGTHTLARQLIVENLGRGLPEERVPEAPRDTQLNLRMDAESIERLKQRAHELRVPFHRLARAHIEAALSRLGYLEPESSSSNRGLSLATVFLLLLGVRGPSGREGEALTNITRIDKLLFLADRLWQGSTPLLPAFVGYRYGPFTDHLYDAERRLAEQGLIEELPGYGRVKPKEEISIDSIMEVVHGRTEEATGVRRYRLTEKGMTLFRRFLADSRWGRAEDRKKLLDLLEQLKKRFGRVELVTLVAYVYKHYPDYAVNSEILPRIRQIIAENPDL